MRSRRWTNSARRVAEQQREAQLPKLGAPEKPAAAVAQPGKPYRRQDSRGGAGGQSAHCHRHQSIPGSIALKGARIDDISLKNYHETVDRSSPIIVLLSPEDGPTPYFAESGYLTAAVEQPPRAANHRNVVDRGQRQADGDASCHTQL